jgi:hypothetical protein
VRRELIDRLKAYFNRYTRAPQGSELRWQELLTELDKGLILRWNFLHHHWSIYYDHNGRCSVIRTFKRPCDFGPTYKKLKKDGSLSQRDLYFEWLVGQEQYNKEVNRRVRECGEEMGREMYKMTRNKVTNDPVKVGNF